MLSFALKTFSFFKSLVVKKPLVNIFPLFRVLSLTKILSNACISPIFSNLPPIFNFLFVETFPLFSKFPAISNFSFVVIVSVFVKLFTDIPFKATNFFEFISFAVNEPLVKISPLFNTFSKTFILSIACIFPEFSNLQFILSSLFVATIPLLSKLFTVIPSLATKLFVVFVSFAEKLPFVSISPVFNTFSVTFISLSASIAPLFVNDEDTSNFFSVTIFPLFSNLFTAILFFALKTFLFLKFPEVKEASVTIFPLLSTFSFIEISSNAWIFPLFSRLPFIFNSLLVRTSSVFIKLFTDIPSKATIFFEFTSFAVKFEFVKISPLFIKFFTSIFLIACIVPVFVKSFVLIPSFVYIIALFSTVPFKLICLFACVPVPDNLILFAFIDIPSSEYAKSFCSYSFPLISIPLPCTLFTFIFPSAVISNLLFLDTIKASEFTPAPLSVLIIFIVFAYIPPKFLASIAISPLTLLFSLIFPFLSVLLEPVTTFKSLATTFPLNSNVFAISST